MWGTASTLTRTVDLNGGNRCAAGPANRQETPERMVRTKEKPVKMRTRPLGVSVIEGRPRRGSHGSTALAAQDLQNFIQRAYSS